MELEGWWILAILFGIVGILGLILYREKIINFLKRVGFIKRLIAYSVLFIVVGVIFLIRDPYIVWSPLGGFVLGLSFFELFLYGSS